MEVLRFFFDDFWHFAGLFVLTWLFFLGIEAAIQGMRK